MAEKDFDIEHFPTTETAKRMMSRISPIYDKSYVGKWLFEVIGLEMEEARILVESLRDQCFIERCTWGMRYWEQRYGITPNETKPLEERRRAVIQKRDKARAMTPATLERILEALTEREVTVCEDNSKYRFTVSIGEGTSRMDYEAVIKKVNTVKPSHLEYSIELARKGTLNLYMAVASYRSKTVSLTDYDQSGIDDITILVDEYNEYLCDEDGNIFIDNE